MRRGPSEADLARAWLDMELRKHVRVLRTYDEEALLDLMDEALQLPTRHMSLQFPLPRILPPELEELRAAIADDDLDLDDDTLEAATALVDTRLARAALARAVLAAGLDATLTAAALLDLASSAPSRLLRSSLLVALAVDAGSVPTPSGLLVAAR